MSSGEQARSSSGAERSALLEATRFCSLHPSFPALSPFVSVCSPPSRCVCGGAVLSGWASLCLSRLLLFRSLRCAPRDASAHTRRDEQSRGEEGDDDRQKHGQRTQTRRRRGTGRATAGRFANRRSLSPLRPHTIHQDYETRQTGTNRSINYLAANETAGSHTLPFSPG